ncbi:hypothetical protein JYU34_001936 [Plutella xylostella]|uniref:Uncharacterized protein n=1 Tax=Plutella xylostella TaxID=51655 RepID=A0ABQ7R574_PLUXY|nr:hypothetical protein JYU34_001936 [Plutella xylostella]
MVSYCCVKDCRNNSSEKKRRSHTVITFHAFPTNPEARSKWLKAIGRPSWDPPNHARVCSAHFSREQINREHQRTRLKDDACPVRDLPANSYFEATEMEVCRMCLATDVKMYSLHEELLKTCFKAIVGLNKDIEGLPQFVCYECAFQLLKCYNLIEKSIIAKATLLKIFSENGEVTKNLVRKINRTELNLKSSLKVNNIVPKTIFDLQYDDDLKTYINTLRTEENICKNEVKSTTNDILNSIKVAKQNTSKRKADNDENLSVGYKIEVNLDLNDEDYKFEESYSENNIIPNNFVNINDNVKEDNACDSDGSDLIMDEPDYNSDSKDDKTFEIKPIKDIKKPVAKVKKKATKSKLINGLTPDEVEMQKYFDIAILTLEEQIEDREKMKELPAYRDALYKCEVCYKTYLHPDAFKMHMDNHSPKHGSVECPVCRLRYKTDTLARSHANRTHGKKFHCKTCPKVFTNVRIAKKHQKRHDGYKYTCESCDFSTIHESAYNTHVRARHAGRYTCVRCGHACASEKGLNLHVQRSHGGSVGQESSESACAPCDLRFSSADEWRHHVTTDARHLSSGAPPTTDPATTCPHCGLVCASPRQLQSHVGSHAAPPAQTSVVYPRLCQHCGETVNNRKEHYFHVRKQHPALRGDYQPLITAVCDTCGKGFQNTTKLHLHELRHGGVGTVRCPHCPRLFYDKYQLARHATVHSDRRPHRCGLCSKSFKLRSNLDRHAKVHSGATPYPCTLCGKQFRYSSSRNLHVRTVHYKQPHPPRKKRTKNVASYE